MLKTTMLKDLPPNSNNYKFFFIGVLLIMIIYSCSQKIDKNLILTDLKRCFYENENSFDSLGVVIADTSLKDRDIKIRAKKIVLKNNVGFENLFLSTNVTTDNDKAFNVKELDYGVSCGFLYIRNPNKDYFENTRLIYKRINNNWYSYIYFN